MKVAGNFQHVQLIPSLMQVIIEVNDCALGLMGESQEEDRRLIADLVLEEMETRCGLMPQELMVSISNLWFRLKTPSCSGPMSAPWCCSNQVIRSCHRYMIYIRLDRQQVLWNSGSESGSRPGSAMSSAPSEGGGARSKEVSGKDIFTHFLFDFLDPLTIPHSPPATCQAKREARDWDVEEGDQEGAKERGTKERGVKEGGTKKEGRVTRGENYLTKKKTRLRWRWREKIDIDSTWISSVLLTILCSNIHPTLV